VDSIDEQLRYACEQVRRLRQDGDSAQLCWWWDRREKLLDARFAAQSGRDQKPVDA
jgi:hypothetical protein